MLKHDAWEKLKSIGLITVQDNTMLKQKRL